MGRFSHKIFWIALITAVLWNGGLKAQWSSSAPGLVGPENQRIGAICYSDGVVWAGANSLSFSKDTGKTWNLSSSFPANDISDIAFYDSLNGLVSTYSNGVYQTRDGGQTWRNVIQSDGNTTFCRVAFNGSAKVMHALENNTCTLYTSTDGGSTWPAHVLFNEGMTFAIGSDKTIYVLSSGSGCWINYSTDLGVNWSDNGAIDPNGDSQGLAVDSCDVHRIYLVNESAVNRASGTANIDLTPDQGQSWQTISSHPLDYYSGSIANTTQVVYVTTDAGKDGVLRSTDDGVTWQSIGGPVTHFDTRSIALANNNIVFVLDSNGTVWTTLNSGGQPLDLGTSTRGAPTLVIYHDPQQFHSNVCGPVYSKISLDVASCLSVSATIDSITLKGSSAFSIAGSGSFPRSITTGDSITLRYWSTTFSSDSTLVQIAYHLSGVARDTTILVVGTSLGEGTTTASAQRQLVSSSFGSSIGLRLLANIQPTINLDSIWPFIISVNAEFSYDSSLLTFSSLTPPADWSTTASQAVGNVIEIVNRNISSSPTQPLDLGTAFFIPRQHTGSLTRLPIDYLVLNTDGVQIPLCIAHQEDYIWAIEVYPSSEVTQNVQDEQDIQVFPNPADNELWIRNTADAPAFVVLSDALGRELLSQTVPDNTTAKLDIESLPSSSYILTCHVNDRTYIRRVAKLR